MSSHMLVVMTTALGTFLLAPALAAGARALSRTASIGTLFLNRSFFLRLGRV